MAEDRACQCPKHHVANHYSGMKDPSITVLISHRLTPIFKYSAFLSAGVNSTIASSIIVGLVSQLWLRKYHPGWYRKYNYILGGALDGGAQVMIFILSFAVFGAAGTGRPFPSVSASWLTLCFGHLYFHSKWAGNPGVGNVDYCNGNGALD